VKTSETTARDPRLDIPLRASTDTTGDVQRVLSKLEPKGNDLKVLRVLANASAGFRPFVLMADALLHQSTVAPDVREVMILHMAARRRVTYEWLEHVPMSAEAGITDEQREVLWAAETHLSDEDLTSFTADQALAIAVVDEVLDHHALSDETWAAAVEAWGGETAAESLLIICWWGAFVPTFIEAVGLQRPN
jgi:hypothetical protein